MLTVEDVRKIREDFPMLKSNPDLIYFDNGATTFKPQCVADAVNRFYTQETCNVHRGDYPLSAKVDGMYDGTRRTIAELIHCEPREVVFTAGASASLNQIAYGVGKAFLKAGDTVLLTEAEHASNLLPWFRMQDEDGIKIEYIPLNKEGLADPEDVRRMMHPGVKAISMAQVTNVLGTVQPIREITKIAHEAGALMIVDGAQSVPHMRVDVKDLDIDFLGFSAHKMCGPSGVGVLYGKYDLLQKIPPLNLGGGSNARFEACGSLLLKEAPDKFEAGTPNIEGVLGLDAAARYLMKVGLDNIHDYELSLRKYFVGELQKLDNIQLFNPTMQSGIVTFNGRDVFAQDAASYLASQNVAVRSGNHCAKILHEIIGTDATVRASLYFYNTKEEVDKAVAACSRISVENAIGIFF
jgi:cysteine desulfurase/selenocysteine lyase